MRAVTASDVPGDKRLTIVAFKAPKPRKLEVIVGVSAISLNNGRYSALIQH